MINKGHAAASVPVVGWQGEKAKPYRLFRLEELKTSSLSLTSGFQPEDGHNPRLPHRIGFHAMMVVTHGSFDHWLDFETYRFLKNQLIYIAPNQIHHFIERKCVHKAWILIFRPELLPAGLLHLESQQTPWSIMSYRWPSITKLKSKQVRLLDAQMDFLSNLQVNYPDSLGEAANHHVSAIIAMAFELAKKGTNEKADCQINNRFFDLVQLIEESFRFRRDVKWYANQLDCSTKTLNRLCQQETGKTVKAFLGDRAIIEAKRLLTYGGDSISSVAEKLGFTATTNFARFFRGETGMTPQEFKSASSPKSRS